MRALDGVVGGRTVVWLVPSALLGLVVAGAAAVSVGRPVSAASDGHPRLPARSAAWLWSSLAAHLDTPLSGTVVETTRLGLPRSLGRPALLDGSRTVRVWWGGPGRTRLAFLGRVDEIDVIRDGATSWTYDSRANSATTATTTALAGAGPADVAGTATPQGALARLLAGGGAGTTAVTGPTQRVAGRPAYTLVLRPRAAGSTLTAVSVAVDTATSVPLRVQVFGAGSVPVWQTAFADVDLHRPAATVFTFRPPGDAAVAVDDAVPSTGPAVHGTGWTSVYRLHDCPGVDIGSRPGASGDRVLSSGPVSAVRTGTGDLYLGTVPPAELERVAAEHR